MHGGHAKPRARTAKGPGVAGRLGSSPKSIPTTFPPQLLSQPGSRSPDLTASFRHFLKEKPSSSATPEAQGIHVAQRFAQQEPDPLGQVGTRLAALGPHQAPVFPSRLRQSGGGSPCTQQSPALRWGAPGPGPGSAQREPHRAPPKDPAVRGQSNNGAQPAAAACSQPRTGGPACAARSLRAHGPSGHQEDKGALAQPRGPLGVGAPCLSPQETTRRAVWRRTGFLSSAQQERLAASSGLSPWWVRVSLRACPGLSATSLPGSELRVSRHQVKMRESV